MNIHFQPQLPVFVPEPADGCDDYLNIGSEYNLSAFIETGGNCSPVEKIQRAYHNHVAQVILVSKSGSAKVM